MAVTAAEVIALTGTSLPEAAVGAIIDDALLIAADCIAGVSEARADSAIKWLSAHLVASLGSEGVLTSRKLGDASKSYARAQVGDGIAGTTYGQQAIAILPCLARVGRARASIEVM